MRFVAGVSVYIALNQGQYRTQCLKVSGEKQRKEKGGTVPLPLFLLQRKLLLLLLPFVLLAPLITAFVLLCNRQVADTTQCLIKGEKKIEKKKERQRGNTSATLATPLYPRCCRRQRQLQQQPEWRETRLLLPAQPRPNTLTLTGMGLRAVREFGRLAKGSFPRWTVCWHTKMCRGSGACVRARSWARYTFLAIRFL